MNMKRLASCAALTSLLSVSGAFAQSETISVDAGRLESDVERRPFGINTDWMLDNDANRSPGAAPLATALGTLRSHYVRYPGGAESDAVRFDANFQPYTARVGANDFPSDYAPIVIQPPNSSNFAQTPLAFDAFMTICNQTGCIPSIVVNHNAYYTNPVCAVASTYPTAQELVTDASNLVAHAKSKGYGIKNWEVGNESYISSYGCNNAAFTASQYAADVATWSSAMKSADSSIHIGANGNSEAWFQTVLKTSAPNLDFLIVHNYPEYQNFTDYQASTDQTSLVANAESAINNSGLSAADIARLKIAVTETNAENFNPSASWKDNNDLSHALSDFELLLQTVWFHPKVTYVMLWATRWIDNSNFQTPYEISDALTPANSLNPSGQVLALINANLKNQIVKAYWSSDNLLHSYATYDQYLGGLNIFLVNRDTNSHIVSTSISNFSASSSVVTQKVFTGTGISDYNPMLSNGSNLALSGNQISLTVPALSITMLQLQGQRTSGLNLVLNAGFELASTSPWMFSGTYWAQNPDSANGAQSLLLYSGACTWQSVTLNPGSTYTLSANAKMTASTGYIGVTAGSFKPYAAFSSTSFSPVSMQFTVPSNVSSGIVWACGASSANATIDDVVLAQ